MGEDQCLAHLIAGGTAPGVAQVLHDHQARTRPGLGQLQGRAEVEPAVDKDAGNARQLVCLAQQDSLLRPGAVGEVVSGDANQSGTPTQP